ncbi:MAG: carboxylesterase family protein [Prevotella sp.]|nr:carboxylesterase family protein [Prevotella sp.]
MKKRRISVLTVMLLAVSLMTTLAWGQGPVVKVEGGMIQGVPSAASGVTVFQGIPYIKTFNVSERGLCPRRESR